MPVSRLARALFVSSVLVSVAIAVVACAGGFGPGKSARLGGALVAVGVAAVGVVIAMSAGDRGAVAPAHPGAAGDTDSGRRATDRLEAQRRIERHISEQLDLEQLL